MNIHNFIDIFYLKIINAYIATFENFARCG